MVFYRKYRPQTIEELDSKEIRDKLYNVLQSPEVSHAFLFTGPKGLGKTSTARIVAKALNCEKRNVILSKVPHRLVRDKAKDLKNKKDSSSASGETQNDIRDRVEPCNECDQCKSITNGTNMDILEIDGASNRGIDEIRDLREKIKLSPMSARKKVYIIDEVHMLTTEAFNALLKTLEEPPSHVVFILCTTEPHKVPATILSRCLHVQFKKATEGELVRSFERIIKREKLEAELDALRLIANLSDGSFRDGVKILEEMVHLIHSGQAKKITKELVEKNYSIAGLRYQMAQMIKSLENKDTKSALNVAAKLASEGVEMGHFMQGLIETLHNSLLFKAGVVSNSESIIQNSELTTGDIKKLIELLAKAYGELKYAVLPQLPLELAIVEWGMQQAQNPVQITQNTQIVRESDSQRLRGSDNLKIRPSDPPSFPSVPKVTQQGISNYNENDALWTALIDKVKVYNHSIAGVLRGCRVKSYDKENLIIETNFKFHKEKLSEPKTQEILGKTLRDVTKKDVKIKVVLKGGD